MRRIITFIIVITFITFIRPKDVLAASLSLSPASGTEKVGDIFSVDIILDTGTDSVSGATAIVNYDTGKLQVQDDDSASSGVQIKQGTIFNQTPLTNSVDTTAGQIRYDSGSLGTSYTGRGTMATIRFKAMAAGAAAVKFVFDSNSTIDTSLVAAATGPTNLLTTVQDGNYNVTLATASATPAPVLLPTGVVENTVVALFGGLILLILSVIFARKAIV
ncbi:hypothetical protein HY440_01765 [Candidatus Microgenomates bacterium]|nr:hypothetical protein [Candidatus Microgenomates bacterium]